MHPPLRLVSFSLLAFIFPLLAGGPPAPETLQVGYATVQSLDAGNLPIGSALFSLRNAEGILVSEAGISAVEPIRAGRIFVDQDGNSTGLALANPLAVSLEILFTLRDEQGEMVGRKTLALGAGRHLARFVNDAELFPLTPPGFLGSLTFEVGTAGGTVAAVTIRQGVSARQEALFATLPLASLDDVATPAGELPVQLVLPQIGAGQIQGTDTSLSTQILLFNLADTEIRGQIQLVGGNGLPLEVSLEGISGSTFSYLIPPNGVLRNTLTSQGPTVQGYAVVTRTQGPRLPEATAVFRFQTPEGLISEAGVGAIQPTRTARILVDNVGTQIGVAVARAGLPAGEVAFELLDRNGFSLATTTRSLPAGGHLAIFVNELFPTEVNDSFAGILEIQSTEPLIPITLKLTTNERGDPILTTLPVADLTLPLANRTRIFPQIGFGFGLSTRLIFLWPDTTSGGRFRLVFTNSDSTPMILPITGESDSQFDYSFNRGGSRQVRPNNLAAPSQLLVDSGMAGQNEIPVSQGSSTVIRTLVIDSEGAFRDDFDPVFRSADAGIATVDAWGEIQGLKAGFSSLTVTLGGIVHLSSIQVSNFSSGPPGFSVEAIAEDASGQLFLTSPTSHRVLTLQSLELLPEEYAGVESMPGHRDAERASALFNTPTFLTLDAANNVVYLADSVNRRIRVLEPGSAGQALTLAGTGAAGNQDGTANQATFSDPQGLTLDSQGGLWIVDRGNHTIRRMELAAQLVSTVAGSPGVAGFQDAMGGAARFSSPTGIAFELEPVSQQILRQQTGAPPPPITVIVADTGNGSLRRVGLDGRVETVAVEADNVPLGMSPGLFLEPTGVGIDAFGTIFVSEPSMGRVSAILPSGGVEQIHQPHLLVRPRGISITRSGRLLIADDESTLREIRFGAPVVESISPSELDPQGGQAVEIRGQNFSSESLVLVSGRAVREQEIVDTTLLRVVTPPLSSAQLTLTVQARGGIAEIPLTLAIPPLEEMPPGTVVTVVGGGTFAGDGRRATDALTHRPLGLAFDRQGNLYLADGVHNRVRRIDAQTGIVQTVAGQGPAIPFIDDVPALQATLNLPAGVALTPGGDLLIADASNHRIRKLILATGVLTTIAGTGTPGFSGDGGPAREARLALPFDVAADSKGAIYVADSSNNVVRRIDPVSGLIESVAGLDGIPAGQTFDLLRSPRAVSVDAQDRVLIADTGNNRIVRLSDGRVSVVAGQGPAGFSGDGGPALEARLRGPFGVIAGPDGNIWVADTSNDRLRLIDSQTGIISTRAGGICCNLDDGVDASEAFLSAPFGLAMDGAGNVVIADFENNLVRRIDAKSNRIGTVLGRGSNGDGGPAQGSILFLPTDLELVPGKDDLLNIADRGAFRVRQVDQSGLIRTVAGNGKAFSINQQSVVGIGDGLVATEAAIGPASIVTTPSDFLVIADFASGRIRAVDLETNIMRSFLQGLSSPLAVDVDSDDNVIIGENGQNRIVVLPPQGTAFVLSGNGRADFGGDGGPARNGVLNLSTGGGLDIDNEPNGPERLFIADTGNHRVRLIANGLITTFAGNGSDRASGDGGRATAAGLPLPIAVAWDEEREILYIATLDNRIRAVDSQGLIHTIAGNGDLGFGGDGGPASLATFRYPGGMAVDSQGNLYVADQFNYAIRFIRAPNP